MISDDSLTNPETAAVFWLVEGKFLEHSWLCRPYSIGRSAHFLKHVLIDFSLFADAESKKHCYVVLAYVHFLELIDNIHRIGFN